MKEFAKEELLSKIKSNGWVFRRSDSLVGKWNAFLFFYTTTLITLSYFSSLTLSTIPHFLFVFPLHKSLADGNGPLKVVLLFPFVVYHDDENASGNGETEPRLTTFSAIVGACKHSKLYWRQGKKQYTGMIKTFKGEISLFFPAR